MSSHMSSQEIKLDLNAASPRGDASGVSSHLKALEAESIFIFREAAAEFAHPVMLYSIGKDSSVMLRLAQKAFYPGQNSVSAPAHRHQLQISRDDRVSRLVRQSTSARS